MVVNPRTQQFHLVCCKTGLGSELKQAFLCRLGTLMDEENLPDHIPFSVTSARSVLPNHLDDLVAINPPQRSIK